jgi:hypothetical protein
LGNLAGADADRIVHSESFLRIIITKVAYRRAQIEARAFLAAASSLRKHEGKMDF